MKKFLLVFCMLVFVGLVNTVKAQNNNQIKIVTVRNEISVKDDLSAAINQIINLKNNSNELLISSVQFRSAATPENLLVLLNGIPVQARYINGFIDGDLSSNPIKVNSKASIQIKYDVKNFMQNIGTVNKFYVPQTEFLDQSLSQQLIINYPAGMGQPIYLSESYEFKDISNQQNQIKLTTARAIQGSLGKFLSVKLKMQFSIDNQNDQAVINRLAIPSSYFNQLIFTSSKNLDQGRKDKYDNNYLLIESQPRGVRSGELELHVLPRTALTEKKINYKNQDLSKLMIDLKQDKQQIYLQLLDVLKPEINSGQLQNHSVSEALAEYSQTSLDYSLIWSEILRRLGYKAYPVYGLVNMPGSSKWQWHFWVTHTEQAKLIYSDPFMEDYLGANMYEQVSPERVVFGLFTDDTDINDLGLSYYFKNTAQISDQSLTSNSDSLELSMDIRGKAISGKQIPLQLVIHNNTNQLVNIEELKLVGKKIKSEQLINQLILPQGFSLVDVNDFVIRNPLLSGPNNISGEAKLKIGDQVQEFEVSKQINLEVDYNKLVLNSVIILLVIYTCVIYMQRRNKKRRRFVF